jgi:hypothetical protein
MFYPYRLHWILVDDYTENNLTKREQLRDVGLFAPMLRTHKVSFNTWTLNVGLDAQHGPLLFHMVPASVHRTAVNTFKVSENWKSLHARQ